MERELTHQEVTAPEDIVLILNLRLHQQLFFSLSYSSNHKVDVHLPAENLFCSLCVVMTPYET